MIGIGYEPRINSRSCAAANGCSMNSAPKLAKPAASAGSVLVLPVRVRDKVPVLVFASGTTRGIDQTSLVQLTAGVQDALERLIFRRKAGGAPG